MQHHTSAAREVVQGLMQARDRFFIAFCNSLIVCGAKGVKLSRVFEVLVKWKTCIYVYSSLYVS